MRRVVICFVFFVLTSPWLGAEEGVERSPQEHVDVALGTFAEELQETRGSSFEENASRLRTHLNKNPMIYGAAIAIINEDGTFGTCPYVFRAEGGFRTVDLNQPSYQIEKQDWVVLPMKAKKGVWTTPYFDEGGGEIWMITKSIPIVDEDGLFAIVTSDLPVDQPSD